MAAAAVRCQSGSSPTFIGCAFSQNNAVGATEPDGGAVAIWDGGHPEFFSCTFTENQAYWDGAVLNFSGVTMHDCRFQGNTANGTGDYYNGSVLGSWKQTGARELTTIELGYLFNGDGSFFATGRVAEVFTFTPDFQTISYSFVEDLFAPDQDPTDPDAEPFDSFGGSGCCINRLNFMD